MKNVQYSTLFRTQELNSREYHLNAYQGNFLPLESVSLIQKHKSYEIFSHGNVDQSLLNLCTKFLGLGEITGRRRPYICKWTILQVSLLILMQLIMALTNYAID